MNGITVKMINSMKNCINFEGNRVTGVKRRVMHVQKNSCVDDIASEDWNYLIELGLADRDIHNKTINLAKFYLTQKGLNFMAELCGFYLMKN